MSEQVPAGRFQPTAGLDPSVTHSYLDRRATAPEYQDFRGTHTLLCLDPPYSQLPVVDRRFLGRERHSPNLNRHAVLAAGDVLAHALYRAKHQLTRPSAQTTSKSVLSAGIRENGYVEGGSRQVPRSTTPWDCPAFSLVFTLRVVISFSSTRLRTLRPSASLRRT